MGRILVVEDDPIIMNLLVILLEKEGHEIVRAETAEQAITAAEACRPDLVLMDVALPGMDGLEATRILKSRTSTRRVPVVALTAQATKADEERAVRAGCDGFIVKPLSTRTFIAEIARYLRNSPSSETA